MEFKDFIKQHTSVPNEYIDSLMSIYDPEGSQTDLSIDLDAVAKYLETSKSSLLKTLRTTYKEGADYVHTTKPLPRTAKYDGNHYKHTLISPNCFKRMCMRSNAPKAEEVRSYFASFDKLIAKYMSHMLTGIEQEKQKMRQTAS